MRKFHHVACLLTLLVACFSCNESESPALPAVTTSAVSEITFTTAIGGGEVTGEGNPSTTARGICWATTSEPTIDNEKTVEGKGLGVFTSTMTGLSASTTYYVRAYATNETGTVYGEEVSFVTDFPVLPTVGGVTISEITTTSAHAFLEVTDDGGSTITEKGVCWNTSQNPTIDNNKTTVLSGFGTYNITNLTSGTTYYVRGYAINSAGVAYGPQTSFTTN
jgi:hypothetical protein